MLDVRRAGPHTGTGTGTAHERASGAKAVANEAIMDLVDVPDEVPEVPDEVPEVPEVTP